MLPADSCRWRPLATAFALLALAAAPVSAEPADVASSAEAAQPLEVGQTVPGISLRGVGGEAVAVRELFRQQPVALVFYRGGWCPYCNLQLAQLHEAEPALRGLGFRIAAISADRPEELQKSIDKHSLGYTLLSDSSMAGARAFGIAFRVSDDTLERYRSFGIDLEAASGESHHILPVPSVFLVDSSGVIRFRYTNPNYRVRLDTPALLAAARRIAEE